MSHRPTRAVLHQRSDSETNELPTTASSQSHSLSAAPAVSQKPPVSSWRSFHSSSSSNKSNRGRKNRAGTTSSTSTTRSNTVRSSGSLDSLPPVPPLRISKHRSALTSNTYAPTTPPDSPSDRSPITSPPAAHVFPRSILKNPFKSSELPPYNTEDYRQRASSWAAEIETFDPIIADEPRMKSPTLRVVEGSEGSGAGQVTESGKGKGVDRPRSVNYLTDDFPSPPGRPDQGARRAYRDQGAQADNRLPPSRSGITPNQAAWARQFPAWARYFYGRKGGRTSLIEPKPEDDPEYIGIAVSDPDGYRGRYRDGYREGYRPRPQSTASYTVTQDPSSGMPTLERRDGRERDPESATLWSLPHLDHTPLSHLENINQQVLFFCLGFVLPIAWMIAAFLPLPQMNEKGKSHSADPTTETSDKQEAEFAVRYENARWWRRINRGMSVIGLLIIGAIIALVVVAKVRS